MSFVFSAVTAGATVVGGIASAAIGAGAATDAANAQAGAANNAANLQYQSGQNSLNVQEQMWQQQLMNSAPWLGAGSQGLSNLQYLMGIQNPNATTFTPGTLPQTSTNGPATFPNPVAAGVASAFGLPGSTSTTTPNSAGTLATLTTNPTVNPSLGASGSLMTPWTEKFQAPNVTEQNDPGYQFRLQQGQQALERSAAAKGNLLSGGTGKALERYGQDYASNEYGNVYNRALGQYQQNYNIFEGNQTNQFNRLATLAGIGQTSANQLNSTGGSTAANIGNTIMNTAGMVGQNINNAGAARGSGYVGSANAWGGALTGGTNNLSQLGMLNMMMQNGGMSNGMTAPGSMTSGGYNAGLGPNGQVDFLQ